MRLLLQSSTTSNPTEGGLRSLAPEPRDPRSGDFNKGLNRKVSGSVALARIWKSGSEGQGPKK